MTDAEIRINITTLVAAVTSIMLEPYQELVKRLAAEGKVTLAEVAELDAAIVERSEDLYDLLKEKLGEGWADDIITSSP